MTLGVNMKILKAFTESFKKSPIICGILLFYLGAGIFAGIFHGITGSFSSVKGANPTNSTSYQSVSSTVVGQIFVPSDESTASAGEGAGEGQETASAEGGSSGSAGEEGLTPSGTESEALAGELGGAEERHYYRFTVVTRIQRLHLRTGPGLTYEIIDWLPKGTTGYVITPGTDWSYIMPDDKGQEMGYSFNGYLDLTEISPEEFPEELKSIEPPIAL